MQRSARFRHISFLTVTLCFVLGAVIVVWGLKQNPLKIFTEQKVIKKEGGAEPRKQQLIRVSESLPIAEKDPDMTSPAKLVKARGETQTKINASEIEETDLIPSNTAHAEGQSNNTKHKSENNQALKKVEKPNIDQKDPDAVKHEANASVVKNGNSAHIQSEAAIKMDKPEVEDKTSLPQPVESMEKEDHIEVLDTQETENKALIAKNKWKKEQKELQRKRLEQTREVFQLRMEAMKYLEN